jgi:hypothetical protein
MGDDGPTPRTTLRAPPCASSSGCKACRHQADADLLALIDAGCGDTPLSGLRFRCAECGSGLTDFVVMSKDSAVVVVKKGRCRAGAEQCRKLGHFHRGLCHFKTS